MYAIILVGVEIRQEREFNKRLPYVAVAQNPNPFLPSFLFLSFECSVAVLIFGATDRTERSTLTPLAVSRSQSLVPVGHPTG